MISPGGNGSLPCLRPNPRPNPQPFSARPSALGKSAPTPSLTTMTRQVRALLFVSLWLIGQACGWSPSAAMASPSKSGCCSRRVVRPACTSVCCRAPADSNDSSVPVPATPQKAIDDSTANTVEPVLLWLLPEAHPVAGMAGPLPTRSLPPPGSIYLRLESLLI